MRVVRNREWVGWIVFLVLARAFDLWTTWAATPDLEHEMNPVVLFFAWGWQQMILYSVVLAVVVLWGFRAALRVRPRIMPDPPATRFVEFVAHVWLGDRRARWRLLWDWPRDRDRWVFLLGVSFMMALTAGSVLAGLNNLLFVLGVHPLLGVQMGVQAAIVTLYASMIALVMLFVWGYFLLLKHLHAKWAVVPESA